MIELIELVYILHYFQQGGANAFVIKSLMNHSRIETTDRYVKVANSVAKQYIDLLL